MRFPHFFMEELDKLSRRMMRYKYLIYIKKGWSNTMELSAMLLDIIKNSYGTGDIVEFHRLEGGYWNDVFSLKVQNKRYVLRISHRSTKKESIVYEHMLLHYMNKQIKEIPAPIMLVDGTTFFFHEGRIISLYPFMEGVIPEITKATRHAAAEMLAKLHMAAQRFPNKKKNPAHTSIKNLNWNHNHMWNWEKLKQQLEKHSQQLFTSHLDHPDQHGCIAKLIKMKNEIERLKGNISQWTVQLANANPDLLFAPTHGDYYRGNLLVVNDQISAVIDWDECRPDWLSYELARATWELCKDKKLHTLNREWAIEFVQTYKNAGGPVPANELQLLIPFIRSVRMIEILFYLDQGFQGEEWDPEYTLHNLYSLLNLASYQELF
ncbi:hypothetical protein WQ54_00800 [Bacillus sp. SA1-12]|uniref:phosphotransferase n=1 Tax=Bacillus sp. SA1-12 TaxID=1455638 RepID=UPI0006259BFE|nr:phosphotransferase [Bacillus sp. SA1-12]KKI94110.1 hypothetical protein WQ54_00800 [Bacillus sp. SA1-12]